jgi:hypothetical protein
MRPVCAFETIRSKSVQITTVFLRPLETERTRRQPEHPTCVTQYIWLSSGRLMWQLLEDKASRDGISQDGVIAQQGDERR